VPAGSRLDYDRLKRLSRRHFVRQRTNGRLKVSSRGRIALIIHRFINQ